ncbi:hypothetical protein [Candidatus Nitrotoga sp. HW29]|uniref:hypothetical protein n=1 Tax=Candidatus Nitrotoga sp. HW29 TaxID=2886963 RepID=UPI001EF33C51|nr:hypothetical protein [Candidatus Nitrotoga sp. HW29]
MISFSRSMAHKNWLLAAAFGLLWVVPFLPSWAASVVEPGPFSVVPREELFLEFVISPQLGYSPATYTRLFTQTENLPPTAQGDFPERSSVRFVIISQPPSPLPAFGRPVSAFGFDLRSRSGIEPRVHFENLFSSFQGFQSDTVTTVISEYQPSGPFLPNALSEKGTISAPGVPSCAVALMPPLFGWSPPPMVPCYTTSEGVRRATTVTGFEFEEFVISGLNELSAGLGIGYELGVTGYFDVIQLRDLPAPKRAGTVIEYRNTQDFPKSPGGNFFYTSDPAEAAFVDSGGAGHFVRTGKSFNAGGFVRTCRFYGSVSPGPNSHFFTVGDADCTALKNLQKTPRPTAEQQWNFEGYSFPMNVPRKNADGSFSCPHASVPVYRAYNRAFADNGAKNAWDSNHRYSTNQQDIAEVVALGWADEGVAMCAPA